MKYRGRICKDILFVKGKSLDTQLPFYIIQTELDRGYSRVAGPGPLPPGVGSLRRRPAGFAPPLSSAYIP